MSLEIIGISVLWIFLFGYVIVGSIDYGAGFFNAYSILSGKQHILSKIIQRYLSPVWEVTNVFFVFFFVGIVGFSQKPHFIMGQLSLFREALRLFCLPFAGLITHLKRIHQKGIKGMPLCMDCLDY